MAGGGGGRGLVDAGEGAVRRNGEVSTCRLCGATIHWLLLAGGRPKPFDEDGRSHFLTCPKWREMCQQRDAERKAAKDRGQGRLF